AQFRFDEAVGEEVVEMCGQAGQGLGALPAAFDLGTHRLEVHEPSLEQGTGHGFQRFVLLSQQLDFVVQRAEDVCDGALFLPAGNRNLKATESCSGEFGLTSGSFSERFDVSLKATNYHSEVQ